MKTWCWSQMMTRKNDVFSFETLSNWNLNHSYFSLVSLWSIVQYSTACGPLWCGTVWQSMAWHNIVQYSTVQYGYEGMAWLAEELSPNWNVMCPICPLSTCSRVLEQDIETANYCQLCDNMDVGLDAVWCCTAWCFTVCYRTEQWREVLCGTIRCSKVLYSTV